MHFFMKKIQNRLPMIKYGAKLQELLNKFFKKMHLSRQKLISALILTMIKNKSIRFPELAEDLNEDVKSESNLRRIQDFFANYDLQYMAYAELLAGFIPLLKFDLAIDRTNWKFGSTPINILCLAVRYPGVGVPILFEMLDKAGNSNASERIDLVTKFVELFGVNKINSIIGDREFIGDKWCNYLISNKIPFFMRLPKSHRITLGGITYRIDMLIDCYAFKKARFLSGIEIYGIPDLNLGLLKRYPNANRSEIDYLAILTNQSKGDALGQYKKRWSIEVLFQSLKTRGFNLENTHLKDIIRIKKLFALVSLAFVLCLTMGVYQDKAIAEIPRKNHGYKANSFFRVGLNKLKKLLNQVLKDVHKFYSMMDRILNYIFNKYAT